jgi:hypothetical protein
MVRAAIDAGVTFYAVDAHGLDANYDPMATSSAMLNYAASQSAQQGAVSLQGYTPNTLPSAPKANAGPKSPATIAALEQGHGDNLLLETLGTRTMELSHEDDYVKFGVSSANTQEALRELAERTGGFLIANTNNVDHLLAHVMEEVDTHYEIAYPPKSEREDGHFRKIEVKLARAGLRVETRTGYFAVPDTGVHPLTPEEMAGLRALDTQPRPHAFDFLSRVYRFRDSGGKGQYAIAFEMPISNLTATPQAAAHQRRLHASLLALVKNADGVIVDRVSKDVPSEVSDDRWETVRLDLMTYQRAVNLPPGRYTVETAVVDHEGNRASTGVVQIENRPEGGIGLSDLTLVRRVEDLAAPADPADPFEYAGKRVLPFVTTHLLPGAQPFVYFVIYPQPENATKAVLRVRLLKDGRPLTTLRPDVPAPDASGGIPLIVTLPTKPGTYEVRATISQGSRTTERTLTFTLAGS